MEDQADNRTVYYLFKGEDRTGKVRSKTDNRNVAAPRTICIIVLIVLCAAVYFSSLSNGFVYDDTSVIIENPWIRDSGFIKDIFLSSAWSFEEGGEASTNYYRPMLHLSLMAGYHIFGINATGFHMVNVIMHSLNAVLVFLIAVILLSRGGEAAPDDQRTYETGKRQAYEWEEAHAAWASLAGPFLAAFIFMLHPMNSEPVNWLSSLSDLQFAFFTLASFYLYIRARPTLRDPWFLASLVLFIPALLSKETAMALIPMIFLYGYFFRKEGARGWARGSLIQYIPFIVIALLYLVLRSYSFSFIAIEKKLDISLYESMLAVFPLLSAYLGKLLFPVTLNVLYPYYKVSTIADMRVILSFLVLAGYLLLLLLTWKFKIIPFLLLWIVIPLTPVLYIPVLTAAPFAERYLYLSTVGFAILYSYSLMSIIRLGSGEGTGGKGKLFIVAPLVITAALLVFYLVKVEARINVWKSDLTLWSDTVKKSPESSTAHFNLGWTYQREHDNEKAEESYLESIRLGPTAVDAHYNLGQIYMQERRYLDASKEFGIVMRIDSGYRKVKKYMERAGAKIKR